jgi:hypothetical protein
MVGGPGAGGYRMLFIVGAVCYLLGSAVLRRVRTTKAR